MRLFIRVIRASDTSMSLDYGDCLALRRTDAEKRGLSVAVTSHPAGPKLPFSCLPQRLCASAQDVCCMDSTQTLWRIRALRIWAQGWPQPRCGWFTRWEQTQGCPRSSANPGLGVSTPLALARQEPNGVKRLPAPSAISASPRETTPWLLRILASWREHISDQETRNWQQASPP